jgi:hypothetical protein
MNANRADPKLFGYCASAFSRSSNDDCKGITRSLLVIVFVTRSAEFLGESDEKPFGPADIAEPIRVFILDYFAYELRAALVELFKRLVDVIHGEHDAEVAQSVHRGVAVIRDRRRREEAGELEPAVARPACASWQSRRADRPVQ